MPLQPALPDFPFSKWGLDFIGPINPPSSAGQVFILTAIDYFTKWAEVMPTLNNSGETNALFFLNHVLSRFGVP